MGYDLYLKPPAGGLDRSRVFAFFRRRNHYELNGSQAWYNNPDTGVYFDFEEIDPRDHAPCTFAFHLNFNRPTFFVLEAEPELTEVVRTFDLAVSDPQEVMSDGMYRPERFIENWRRGNEIAFAAMYSTAEQRSRLATLPAARLLDAWKWNLDREALQASIGDSPFVPSILFCRIDGRTGTALVWTDSIPILFPAVDHVLVLRDRLARRGRPKPDIIVLPLPDVLERLKRHVTDRASGVHQLGYEQPPQDVVEFVRGVNAEGPHFEALPADQVVEAELVAKFSR